MDDDLLERARRLCSAVNLVAAAAAFPPLRGHVSKVCSDPRPETRTAVEERGESRERQQAGDRTESSRLPKLGSRGGERQPFRREQSQNGYITKIALTQEQRQQREADKVRQAQERARARVVRTNQQETCEAQQQVEMRKLAAIEAAEKYAENMRRVEESRLRAQERVREKRIAMPSNQEQVPAARPDPVGRPVATTPKQPPRRVLVILQQGPNPKAAATREDDVEQQTVVCIPTSDTEQARTIREKKLRQETARRLRRMLQQQEEANRKQIEDIQRGLLDHKNKQQILDRVAKGFVKPDIVCEVPTQENPGIALTESSAEEHDSEARTDPQPEVLNAWPTSTATPAATPLDEDETARVDEQLEALTVEPGDIVGDTPSVTGSAPSSRCRRVPPWKRPPVPLLPAECYSYKAILSTEVRSNQCARGVTSSDSYQDRHSTRRITSSQSDTKR